MRTKARIGFAAVFCVLLAVTVVKGWLWYNQLTQRIFTSVQEQIGFELGAEQIQYDPVSEKLLLGSVSLSNSGLDISAGSLELGISSPRWRDIGRQVFPVTIEYASFAGSDLRADAPESLLPLSDLGNIFFHQGVMRPGLNSRPLSFSFLGLNPQSGTSVINIESSGGNGLNWSFNGILDAEKNGISGHLNFEQQDIAKFLTDNDYSGAFDASLKLSWVGSEPLLLSGDLQGGEGGYQSDGFLLHWEGWQFSNVQIADWQFAKNSQVLALDKTDLQFSIASISPLFNWLKALPFVSSHVEISRLNINSRPDSDDIVFTDAELNLNDDNKTYQFTGESSSGGHLFISADISGSYQLRLENETAQNLGLLPVVKQHDFSDRRYNFTYNSNSGVAGLLFRRQKPLKDLSLTERLLFDSRGRAELSFTVRHTEPFNLKGVITSRIGSQLETINSMPFTYLSQIVDNSLSAYLEHVPGKPELTSGSQDNLKTLKKLSDLRPGLKWQLETSVSDTEDWPLIARHQLEQTLTDLYPGEGAPPEEEREALVEQLYLVTQKQKIPDVGVVSKDERVLQAEQWLVDSWPRNPELINQLLDERKKYLATSLQKIGLNDITILSAGKNEDQPRSRLLVK